MAFTYIGTHVYKKRIGPWGLVARVSLEVRPLDVPPRGASRIDGSRVWWVPPQGIVPADKTWMGFGLGLVAGQLEALGSGSRAVLVRVLAWDVPMVTDHQAEVAAAAVIECLRQNHGIDGVDIGLTFDRERNRHRFTWNGTEAEPGRP
ncbi:hypothetical protein [Streptomyces puniciscabiei]|uniref:hypothetical protein n=1 Tax=Streptomyces puniciscabiei TaxID=164348 RepID=UPI003332FD7D